MYTTGIVRVVWAKLISFDLQAQIHKNYNSAHNKARTEWCWSTHMCQGQNWYPLQSSKLQLKAEFTETCPLADWYLVISDWHRCYSAKLYVPGRVWAVTVPPVVFQYRLQKLRVSPVAPHCGAASTKFLQWHSSVGLFQLSFSSGVLVYPASIRWVAQWYPSVHWVNQWHSSGIPVYTGSANRLISWQPIMTFFNVGQINYSIPIRGPL